MIHKRISKDSYIRSFKWLLDCSKPYLWIVIALSAISVLSAVAGVGSAVLSKEMVDNAISGHSSRAVLFIVLFMSVHLLILGLGALATKVSVELNEKLRYRIEQSILKQLYKSDWMAYSQIHSGDVVTRLTDDVTRITSLLVYTIPNVIALGFRLVCAFAILCYYDAVLALAAFAIGPLSIVISFLLGQKLKSLQHEVQTAESRHRSYITELVQHMLIIKTFQYEQSSMERVRERQDEKYRWVVRRNKLGIVANMIMSGGYWLGYVVAFVYGVFKLRGNATTFGTFTAFLQLVGQIQQPFTDLARSVPQILSGFASVERLSELETLESELPAVSGAVNGSNLIEAGIALEDVVFGYQAEANVLSGASLRVEPGEIVALIGSSGEGKTTVMRLLLSLVKARSGSIYVYHNHERIPISSETRRYFAYVPQGNTLFSGTILDNLKIGSLHADADDLERAVRAACAWDFINELPDKLHSVVGEGGAGLSEGQAQRLCLARAFIRPSPILLLDEATSALDMETEKAIFENLRKIYPRKTCLIVTHRLSVLPLCDRVYRLENGKLYEHDTAEFSNIITKEKTGRVIEGAMRRKNQRI